MLRHPALPREIMWDWDNDSEPELGVKHKAQSQPKPHASDTDDSENASLLSHTRVPEEKAEQARQQEARAKQARSTPLKTATVPQPENVINTQPLGHAEVVAMARTNQRAQKRPRTTRKQPSRQPIRQSQKPQQHQVKPKYPGTPKRPQWLKDTKARLTKPSASSDFDQKSKAAALQQTKNNEANQRELRYSSSSENKNFTSIIKNKLKFSPTVKILHIESDSPGTPPFEIITSSNPNDFMNDDN